MVGAAHLLYCSAMRLFERDLALIATVIFCLHPVVVFASIDVRPYAFAALAINLSVFALVCLRDNDSAWLAALFGLAATSIVQIQLLFAVILPALLLCFLALKNRKSKSFWRQLSVASASFGLGLLAAVHRLRVGCCVHHRGSFCHENPPAHLRKSPGPLDDSPLSLRGAGASLDPV